MRLLLRVLLLLLRRGLISLVLRVHRLLLILSSLTVRGLVVASSVGVGLLLLRLLILRTVVVAAIVLTRKPVVLPSIIVAATTTSTAKAVVLISITIIVSVEITWRRKMVQKLF